MNILKYKILGGRVSILAILFLSLMPLISQAFEKDQSNNYQVICSSNGLKLIETSDGNGTSNKSQFNLNHCSYCAVASDDKAFTSKEDKFKNILTFSIYNKTIFSTSNKQNILENNLSQAPPSI
tara:strand:- start:326 stop:697 length:372 start_codon:yes stop_codon:yes gene_type:complete